MIAKSNVCKNVVKFIKHKMKASILIEKKTTI